MKQFRILAAFAIMWICSVAMGSVPIFNPDGSVNGTGESALFAREMAPHGVVFESPALLQSLPDPKPFVFEYQFATDGERYTLTSTPVLPDLRGIRGLNGVWSIGYRSRGQIPVTGFGLEYEYVIELDPRIGIVIKPTINLLFVQGERIEQSRLRFGFSAGVRF